jgi:hypothetical protein
MEIVLGDSSPVTDDSANGVSIRTGQYEHYKGGRYLVLGLAEDARDGTTLVIYIRLYGAAGRPMAARPLDEFFEEVETPNGLRPRFRLIRGDDGVT